MVYGTGAEGLPKNARKYVPVGLGRAIPGAPRFWEAFRPGSDQSSVIALKRHSKPPCQQVAKNSQTSAGVGTGFQKMSEAMDGRSQAHTDVLVAVFWKPVPTPATQAFEPAPTPTGKN